MRPAEPGDREQWEGLFAAYRRFYGLAEDEEKVEQVWGWIHDPGHETGALVAELDGRLVGLAHHRLFARPSEAQTGLHLDDLFTDPDVRGRGVGRALIGGLAGIARERGAVMVRWVTAADNHLAQRLYDRVARRTSWVTYDLDL